MTKMRTFRLNKLVRDGIVASHEREGGSCVSTKLGGLELEEALKKKLREEVDELLESEARELSEYGDVQEVLEVLAVLDGFTKAEIEKQASKRSAEIGSFKDGIYVDTVTVPDTSWLAKYYASRPKRFPEVLND